MTKKLFLLLLPIALLTASCNEEGEGGTAVIKGTVMAIMHDKTDFDLTHDTLPAAKQDVYIEYGTSGFVGDDVEAGADGRFRFQYLNPGSYTIYAYSELASGERVAEKRTVSIKRGSTTDLGTIYIHKGKAYGTSLVKGQVRCTYFDKNGDVETTWALGERVYLQRQGDPYYIDDTRVGQNGYYYFSGVEPGSYTIYALAEDSDEIPYAVSTTLEVSQADTLYTASQINIRLKT